MLKQSLPRLWRANKDLTPASLSEQGVLETVTVVYQGINHTTPYIIGTVAISSGEKILARIVDWIDPHTVIKGLPVKAVVRKLATDGNDGIITYGRVFSVVQ